MTMHADTLGAGLVLAGLAMLAEGYLAWTVWDATEDL